MSEKTQDISRDVEKRTKTQKRFISTLLFRVSRFVWNDATRGCGLAFGFDSIVNNRLYAYISHLRLCVEFVVRVVTIETITV